MTARLPPIIQFSYLVTDLDAAIEHWAGTLSVGPFFVLEHVPFANQLYRGDPCEADISVALAYSGPVQIELVQQHNDARSIFFDFLSTRGEGLQHVGAITQNLDEDLAALAKVGAAPVQWGEAENGTRFAYLNTDKVPGAMLELFQLPTKVASAFDYMQAAAQKWRPGIDPARR
ncbi:MAG: VOC family protein [Lysobacterales bacterium]